MQVFYEIEKIRKLSLALGFFDGIHIGHQSVLNNAVKLAKFDNTKSAVITFKEHPKSILTNHEIKLIMDNKTKVNIMSRMNVDYVFFLDFNKFRYMNAIDFLKLLIEYFSPIAITTGSNYSFGYKKFGNTELLSKMANEYHYNYCEVGAIKYNNNVVSSTLIRQLINNKKYNEANTMLGYRYLL